ncbi:AI-2E family transporter [Yoonia sp.]|uniref:AI-2E family transporter n=1 Tax=Yoonia sp. TaxID=2212373 RepID=UPI003A4D1D23
MTIYWKVFAWAGLAALAGVLLWLLSPMLLPFVFAMVLAYFLDPIVRKLVSRGMPRVWAALLVAFVSFGTLIAIVGTLVPLAVSQASELIETLPGSLEEAQSQVEEVLPDELSEPVQDAEIEPEGVVDWLRDSFASQAGMLAQGVSGVISFVLFWVVMPVVTIYLLIDFPKLIRSVDNLLPRPSAPTLRKLAKDIDTTLSGYIRGQSLVCVILMGYYSVALTLVGLPFALIVGIVTGAVSFIPYIGMFIGTSLGMGAAIWQFWDEPIWIAAVGAIYAVGLFVESEIMVPRLVGSAVNLHPVWMIFAVMAFGTLFGFVGAIIAVPMAAVTGVVVRFLVDRYYRSSLYTGTDENRLLDR